MGEPEGTGISGLCSQAATEDIDSDAEDAYNNDKAGGNLQVSQIYTVL